MRTGIYALICVICVVTACVPVREIPAEQNRDKLAEIRARGTLVIATDADYAPQSQLLDVLADEDTWCEPTQYTANQFDGFDAAVAKEIALRLGVEPCFVTPPWSQLVAGNWGDNWDIHVGSVAITFERLQNLYFSMPYYATPTVVLVHKDNTTFEKPEDLSGKRIGVCVGCTFEDYLKGTLKIPGEEIEYRIQNAEMVGYENELPAIEDLSAGDGVNLDAVITILPYANGAILSGKPVKIIGDPLLYAYASVTMDRASKREVAGLWNEINRIVEEMHNDGTLGRLSVKYQGQDLTQEAARFDISALGQNP